MYGCAAAAPGTHFVTEFVDLQMLLVILGGILAAMPVIPWIGEKLKSRTVLRDVLAVAGLVAIFVLCTMKLAAGTHNPFIYFRF
jgi:alginate O-acetyltransferase complex protein AlgI